MNIKYFQDTDTLYIEFKSAEVAESKDLDENSAPSQRYYDFLDQTESGRILAEAIREAYGDLFAINKNAQDMTVEEVKNKLRTLTQGQKSENVLNLMANTFKALTALADWD